RSLREGQPALGRSLDYRNAVRFRVLLLRHTALPGAWSRRHRNARIAAAPRGGAATAHRTVGPVRSVRQPESPGLDPRTSVLPAGRIGSLAPVSGRARSRFGGSHCGKSVVSVEPDGDAGGYLRARPSGRGAAPGGVVGRAAPGRGSGARRYSVFRA